MDQHERVDAALSDEPRGDGLRHQDLAVETPKKFDVFQQD
jgi:hypothetical protein